MGLTLHILDFQSIKKAKLLVEGFTVIHGPNNSGKSAVIRAIRGVVQNTRGTSFVRRGAAKTSVELTFGDGHSVLWEKGAKVKPTYVVDGGKPINPGQAVPDEVLALGIRPLILSGNREVWPQVAPQFAGQVFLIDQPGSVVAEAIADVERVSQLNEALKLAEADRRTASQELKVRQQDQALLKAELDGFAGLDEVLRQVREIEVQSAKVVKIEKAIAGLESLRDRLTQAQMEVSRLEGVTAVEVPSSEVPQKAQATLADLRGLEALRDRWKAAQALVARLEPINEVEDSLPDPTGTRKVLAGLELLEGLKSRWVEAQRVVTSLDMELQTQREALVAEEVSVRDFLVQLGVCPMCGERVAACGDR